MVIVSTTELERNLKELQEYYILEFFEGDGEEKKSGEDLEEAENETTPLVVANGVVMESAFAFLPKALNLDNFTGEFFIIFRAE